LPLLLEYFYGWLTL